MGRDGRGAGEKEELTEDAAEEASVVDTVVLLVRHRKSIFDNEGSLMSINELGDDRRFLIAVQSQAVRLSMT